jgi:uncharacterized protein YjeT (DUF2065 family)
MSDSQIFQIFSLAYLAIGIGIFINPDFYKKMLSGFMENPATLYLGGLMALIIGFLIVTFHNTWTMDLSVIITIIGWIALIKGIVILIFPKTMIVLSKKIINSPIFMKIEAAIATIAGLAFSYLGFCPKSPFN